MIEELERAYRASKAEEDGVRLFHAYRKHGIRDDRYIDLRAELGYIYEIADIPIPSENQRKAFAEYVARAHSWYKHLHPHDPTFFFFQLHPTVMMILENGKPILAEKEGIHYSHMPTLEYRDFFGYLSYSKGISSSITCENGTEIQVPNDFADKSKTGLTAYVYEATFYDGPYYHQSRSWKPIEKARKENQNLHRHYQENDAERYQRACEELGSILSNINYFLNYVEEEKNRLGLG